MYITTIKPIIIKKAGIHKKYNNISHIPLGKSKSPMYLIVNKKTSFIALKKVSDVFSDWHVAPEKKELIPVIQILNEKSQGLKAILGGFLGYKDWIVKL